MVFGHVVGEKPPAEETQPAAQPAAADAANRPAATTSPVAQAATTSQVKAFLVTVAPKATENVASDATFSSDALVNALRNELRARNLLAEQRSPPDGTLQIQVSEVALRPSSNAVVFGYKMMASTLIADVRLSGADDQTAALFHIAAQARLTLSTHSQDGDRDQPKEQEIPSARSIAASPCSLRTLTEIWSKPDPEAGGDIPRFLIMRDKTWTLTLATAASLLASSALLAADYKPVTCKVRETPARTRAPRTGPSAREHGRPRRQAFRCRH